MQGQLRNEALSFSLETECAHCGRLLHLEIDSDLHVHVLEQGAEPVISVPLVDFDKLEDPSIIDAF